jgi:uncharacterized protein HemY
MSATLTEIKKPKGLYLTMAQTWRARGDVYIERGDKYAAEGRMTHAEGCWKKAEKKYLKARALEDFRAPWPKGK